MSESKPRPARGAGRGRAEVIMTASGPMGQGPQGSCTSSLPSSQRNSDSLIRPRQPKATAPVPPHRKDKASCPVRPPTHSAAAPPSPLINSSTRTNPISKLLLKLLPVPIRTKRILDEGIEYSRRRIWPLLGRERRWRRLRCSGIQRRCARARRGRGRGARGLSKVKVRSSFLIIPSVFPPLDPELTYYETTAKPEDEIDDKSTLASATATPAPDYDMDSKTGSVDSKALLHAAGDTDRKIDFKAEDELEDLSADFDVDVSFLLNSPRDGGKRRTGD